METATFHQVQDAILLGSTTRILANAYESGRRMGVLVESFEARDSLDNMLWTYKKGSFVPHATELDPQALIQPIYITTTLPFYNMPDTAVLVNVGSPEAFEQKHLIVVFTDAGKHINSIRSLYKSLKESNCELNFVRES